MSTLCRLLSITAEEPTVFAPAMAYAVPPSTTKSAMKATSIDGDGTRIVLRMLMAATLQASPPKCQRLVGDSRRALNTPGPGPAGTFRAPDSMTRRQYCAGIGENF